MLAIRLLGKFDLRLDGQAVDIPSRPAQSLLAYLLLNPGSTHRREMLAGLLWPDAGDTSGRRNLRQALWQIRRALEAGGQQYLATDDIAIAFHAQSEFWLDTSVLDSGDGNALSLDALIDMVTVYHGELLPGFYDDWLVLERERLQIIFEHKMALILDRLIEAGRLDDILEWGERWVALGYAPEPAYRALMIAHAGKGDFSGAAAVYRRCQDALNRELGVEPSETTRILYETLAKGGLPAEQVLSLSPIVRRTVIDEAPTPGEPPFKGLQFFNEDDASSFFGREKLVGRLVSAIVDDSAVVAVIGASGSGKSSLVRAGLIPALRNGSAPISGSPTRAEAGWQYRILTPTARPLEALAVGLGGGEGLVEAFSDHRDTLRRAAQELATINRLPLLLVVDQFEELFTLCRSEPERQAFVDNLMSAVSGEDSPARLVIVLRADFYARCAQYAELRAALVQRQEYIGPMNAEELRRAIEEPARLGRWEFEPGLVDLLLRDIGEEPGALPLLSHALLETWKRRRANMLTLRGYAEAGGIHGAIARTATSVYRRLDSRQQVIARGIFLRLTELGDNENGVDTRRRATLGELIPQDASARLVKEVMAALADARLIIIGEDTAEVAHEALIREWPELRAWLAEDRQGLAIHRHLTETAQTWEALERDPEELYRGARLTEAGEWSETHLADLSPLESQFLAESLTKADRETAERDAQRHRELESAQMLAAAERRRATVLVVGLVATIILAAVAGGLGLWARQNAMVAASRELAAASINNLSLDPERSILLALYALDQTDTTQARDALYRAVQESRLQFTLQGHQGPVEMVSYSADGTRILTAGDDRTARLWDSASGKQVSSIAVPEGIVFGNVTSTAASGDGSRIAFAAGSLAQVQDVPGGQVIVSIHVEGLQGLSLNKNGTRLATATTGDDLFIWDVSAPSQPIAAFKGLGRQLGNPFFSADDRYVAAIDVTSTTDYNAGVVVWDIATGTQVLTVEGYRGVFSPDGNRLAVITGPGQHFESVWDVSTRRQLFTLSGHTNSVVAITFSPDGSLLATGGWDQTARVWDANTGTNRITLTGHNGPLTDVAFSPDGTHLLTASVDGTARIWDIAPRQGVITINAPTSEGRVTFSPDGAWVVLGVHGGGDVGPGRVFFWDSKTGEQRDILVTQHVVGVDTVAFSKDGKYFATASYDGTVGLWRLDKQADGLPHGQPLSSLAGGSNSGIDIYGVGFSPDGSRLASSNLDGIVKLWDVATGKEIFTAQHPVGATDLAFSPDGSQFATAGFDGVAHVWNIATGQQVMALSTSKDYLYSVAYSHDGRYIGTAGTDGTAKIWDVATGRVILTLSGHTSSVESVDFSPNDRQIVTASDDGTAKLWDASTGREVLSLSSGGGAVASVALSPDGTRLAMATHDQVRIYPLLLEDLVTLARSKLTRGFTPEECQTYLHLATCPAGW